jgi:ABC-type dipeptide/oligopeptide/nickel transport system permease component
LRYGRLKDAGGRGNLYSAALRQNSLVDYGSMFAAILGYTTPSFVLGVFLIVRFAVHWHTLPAGGWGKPASMIMPIVTLAAAPIAILARYTRASMLDIRSQDYVRTARAKGLRDALDPQMQQ